MGSNAGFGLYMCVSWKAGKNGQDLNLSVVCLCAQSLSHVQLFVTPSGYCPWNFPGKDTGAGCHFLLLDLGILKYQVSGVAGIGSPS